MFEQTSRVYAQPMFGICSSCKTNSFCSGVDKYKIQFQCELFPAAAIRYNVSPKSGSGRTGTLHIRAANEPSQNFAVKQKTHTFSLSKD